jgi:hypothetical protein
MARPRGNRKEARTSVSFDVGEYAQLCTLAERRDVSVAWLIRQAVHELIRKERDVSDNPELPLVKRSSYQRSGTVP